MRKQTFIGSKLFFAAVLSTLWAVVGQAHELQPAIANLEIVENEVVLTLDLNIEAYAAGIDLDGIEDTDEATESVDYDALRAMEPDVLAQKVPGLVDGWNGVPLVTMGGAPVTMSAREIVIPEVGNIEQIRPSRLVLVGPASGETIQIAWPKGAGDMVLRQQGVEEPFTGFLSGGSQSPELPVSGGSARSGWSVFAEYIPVGFDHIVPKGLDHILFVLGLFLFSTAWRPLLAQVTSFTLAHTVTLALGALGWVNISGSIVEPLIALSIVYVAVENIFARDMKAWRPVIIFCFGLLHGLGFASVLGEFGLPEAQFVPALIGFNIGVEIGQLAVIGVAALLLFVSVKAALKAQLPAYEAAVEDYSVMFRAVSIPGSIAIALIGAYWVIERTLL